MSEDNKNDENTSADEEKAANEGSSQEESGVASTVAGAASAVADAVSDAASTVAGVASSAASAAKSAASAAAEAVSDAVSGEDGRGLRKQRVGVVVSDKMQKTIVVDVVRRVPHPRFKKIIKRTTKIYAHDEEEKAVVGDKVLVEETRPISKKKCWKLVEIQSHH